MQPKQELREENKILHKTKSSNHTLQVNTTEQQPKCAARNKTKEQWITLKHTTYQRRVASKEICNASNPFDTLS